MGSEGESANSSLSGEVSVNIKLSNGTKFSTQISLESLVGDFKVALAQNCDVPAEQQRLIYKGRILKDDQTLESYGLQADHTVHMVRGFAPAASTAVNTTSTVATSTVPGIARSIGANEGGIDFGASLFPGLGSGTQGGAGTGGPGLFGAGIPEFEQVQQQLTQNPNIMREIMNMPAIQGLMNNPDLMRSLISNNPQMRDIIDRNPELGHILNDPAILRQTLEAARNPELMREMMRNTDRAMSNIESSPEGFNMLRRMYETVQEPFMNATTAAGGAANDSGPNPFAALLGNQAAAQTREVPSGPTTTGSDAAGGVTSLNTNPLPNPWSNTSGNTQSNSTTRSVPGDPRTTSPGGLSGLGLPGMERLFPGSVPDSASLNQVLQNPVVSQMMQGLLSNPQYMNQLLNSNPQIRSLLDSSPQAREIMQNPEIVRQLSSPEAIQQVLALQQSFLSQMNPQQGTQDSSQTVGTTAGNNNLGMQMLMNMFGGLNASTRTPNAPPEEAYATQLSQLQEMGFLDRQENIRALSATAGNVHAAVERLLGNFG